MYSDATYDAAKHALAGGVERTWRDIQAQLVNEMTFDMAKYRQGELSVEVSVKLLAELRKEYGQTTWARPTSGPDIPAAMFFGAPLIVSEKDPDRIWWKVIWDEHSPRPAA